MESSVGRRQCARTPTQELPRPVEQSRGDDGFSLIEVVIAIALMSILIVPIMVAVITAIEASSRSRSAAQVETMVVNAADRVNRAPKSCDYSVYARAAVVSQGWSSDLVAVDHAYYQPHSDGDGQVDLGQPGSWVWGPDACELDEPSELEVQIARITITSPDRTVTRTIEVVKSDV
ncbi:MAG: type II secretion system protein [Rhodococcus sp.]|nr:type II secretion system protein [Rhodococcus sp. (in: high G+C Gram-positive bacteria)]